MGHHGPLLPLYFAERESDLGVRRFNNSINLCFIVSQKVEILNSDDTVKRIY